MFAEAHAPFITAGRDVLMPQAPNAFLRLATLGSVTVAGVAAVVISSRLVEPAWITTSATHLVRDLS